MIDLVVVSPPVVDQVVVSPPAADIVLVSAADAPPIGFNSNTFDVSVTAGADLGGHRVVYFSEAGIVYASASFLDAQALLGVTLHAALSGASVLVRLFGSLSDPSWNWYSGPVYLGENGHITQIVPTIGFVQEIGSVINPKTIAVRIQPEIRLG